MLVENMKAQRKLREMRPERIKSVIVFLKVLVRVYMHKVAWPNMDDGALQHKSERFPPTALSEPYKGLSRGQKSWQSIV